MNERIQEILRDLYAIDETFRSHERELTTLVEKILISKPDTKFDIVFAEKLRKELLASSGAIEIQPAVFWTGAWMRLAVGGIATIVLVFSAILYMRNGISPAGPGSQIAFGDRVTVVDDGAFGTLALNAGSQAQGEDVAVLGSEAAMSMSAKSAEGTAMGMSIAPNAGGMGGGSTGMIAPDYYPMYRYAFNGELPDLADSGVVLRRKRGIAASEELVRTLEGMNIPGINVGSFSNLKVRFFEAYEDRDRGYMFNINFEEGVMNIGQNWNTWPTEPMPMMAENSGGVTVPDGEIISIANNFLAKYGIDRTTYGEPFVANNDWGRPMPLMETSSVKEQSSISYYAPMMATVTYPLELDGRPVYEDGGHQFGLQITVALKERQVVSAYNMMTQRYDASKYVLETDKERIETIAERGGVYGYVPPAGTKAITVELGNPEMVWMRHFQWREGGEQTELFVPALAFPVSRPTNDINLPKMILVPLVKDMLNVENVSYPRIETSPPMQVDPAPPATAPGVPQDL